MTPDQGRDEGRRSASDRLPDGPGRMSSRSPASATASRAGPSSGAGRSSSYPAQLQAMLGERFCVRNFGVNGHAVQRSADRPYWSSDAFTPSSAFEPDVVLIMLGTNDSRGDNWKGVGPFSADYRELVAHYQSLESSPRVWLLTPPALFRLGRSAKVRYGMDEQATPGDDVARSRNLRASSDAASSTSTDPRQTIRRRSGSMACTLERPARLSLRRRCSWHSRAHERLLGEATPNSRMPRGTAYAQQLKPSARLIPESSAASRRKAGAVCMRELSTRRIEPADRPAIAALLDEAIGFGFWDPRAISTTSSW